MSRQQQKDAARASVRAEAAAAALAEHLVTKLGRKRFAHDARCTLSPDHYLHSVKCKFFESWTHDGHTLDEVLFAEMREAPGLMQILKTAVLELLNGC